MHNSVLKSSLRWKNSPASISRSTRSRSGPCRRPGSLAQWCCSNSCRRAP